MHGDLAANLTRHLALIEEARASGIDLVVFPELSLTGYLVQPDCDALALSHASEPIAQLAAAARGIVVSFGFIERGGAVSFHNAQALAAEGSILQVHRKANLPGYGRLNEPAHYRPGGAIALAALPGDWKLATLICADLWNPALPWLAALQGADLIVVPAASARDAVADFDNPAGWDLVLRHTALIYGLPVVMANHCGGAFWGGSRILDGNGNELARAHEGERLIAATVTRDAIAAARARLPTVRDADPELVARELARLHTERRRHDC